MHFLTLAEERYTTKKYNAQKKISEQDINQLKEVIRLSPSSINSQPWKFTFVSDEKIKEALAAVSFFNQQKILDSSHLVVFSAIDDVSKFEAQIQEHLPQGSIDYYNKMLKPLPEEEIKFWLRHQVYLSLGFFLSACASMGIDSTPMEGIQPKEYNNILKLDGFVTLFAVAIGYRDIDDANQPSLKSKFRLPASAVIGNV